MNQEKDKIVIYQGEDGKVELRADVEKDTLWATQEQISRLFNTERSVITKHLANIIKDGELQEKSVCADIAHTAADGKTYKVKSYNLDAIIAVGYRVNSIKATQFRIWATGVLRQYVVSGYALNHHRLGRSPEALVGLYDAISMLESEDKPGKLKGKITIKLEKELKPRTK